MNIPYLMLSKSLTKLLNQILENCIKMVQANVDSDDVTGRIDYLSIFARSQDEYENFRNELAWAGKVSIQDLTGDYYLLHIPLSLDGHEIRLCRVVKPGDHRELGYADFEVKDFVKFKTKYAHRGNFRQINVKGEEMIELTDPQYNVRAYFLSGEFYLE